MNAVAEPKPAQATDGRTADTTYATPSRGGEAGRERWWLVCGILETLSAQYSVLSTEGAKPQLLKPGVGVLVLVEMRMRSYEGIGSCAWNPTRDLAAQYYVLLKLTLRLPSFPLSNKTCPSSPPI